MDKLGDEMSTSELANILGEKEPEKKAIDWAPRIGPDGKPEPMPLEVAQKIVDEAKKEEESNDIYKIAARVKNLCRSVAGANLTDTGERLANCYIHVCKALYDFAETIKDEQVKADLIKLIRSHEGMPADFIMAIQNGLK